MEINVRIQEYSGWMPVPFVCRIISLRPGVSSVGLASGTTGCWTNSKDMLKRAPELSSYPMLVADVFVCLTRSYTFFSYQ